MQVEWDCDEVEYRAAVDWYSNTQIEKLRVSPGRFRGLYITRTIKAEERSRDQQDRLDFGKAFHMLLLQPALFAERAHVCDTPEFRKAKESRSSKAWKEWKKDLEVQLREECGSCDGQGEIVDPEAPLVVTSCAHCRGAGFVPPRDEHFLLKPRDRKRLDDMADAAWSHPELAEILGNASAPRERALRWCCPVTGLQLKTRLDLADRSWGFLELKSCEESDPETCSGTATSKGYHRQLAHEAMGFHAWTGTQPDRQVLAFVSKQPPHDVGVYELDADSSELGHEERLADLQDLRRRLDEDDWSAPHSRGVQALRLRRWAFPPDQPITLGGKEIL